MKKRKNPYDRSRRHEHDEQEPWKQDFVPGLVQPGPAAKPQPPPPRASQVPSADAILARLKAQPSSLDDLIGFFDLKKLPDQSALEKRLLELVRAGQTVLDRRGRLVPAASGAAGLPQVPTPIQVAPSPANRPAPKPVSAPPQAQHPAKTKPSPAKPVVPAKPVEASRAPKAKVTAAAPTADPAFLPKLAIETAPVSKAKSSARVGLELTGKVSAHRDGFGFVVPEPKLDGGEDVFLPAREMRGLMTGDRARVRVVEVDHTGRLAGEFIAMVSTAPRFAVGRLRQEGGRWWLTPDNQKAQPFELQIQTADLGGAKVGQVVRAEIITVPGGRGVMLGRVTEVVGEHLAPGLEIEIALRRHDLPYEWPAAVEAEAKAIAPTVSEADANSKGRVDIRKLPLVTIDGADARDFDDAVYASKEKLRGGYKLIVAIADVSSYVKVGTPLDEEARERGTSVYFPRRVIPMLPEKLSNGLCSLNPNVDRLCMVCEMRVSKDGEVSNAKFYEGVMNSQARLIYDDVADMLANPKGQQATANKKLLPHIQALEEVFEALFRARLKRGAIDFEGQETKFEFSSDSKIERIVPVVRNKAHRMIEECMIAANVQAAMFVAPRETPTLYRVHERPDPIRVATLKEFLATRGLTLGGGEAPAAGDFAKVTEQAKGRPDTGLIHMMILRTMTQARYAPDVLGHYGLALTHYGHFTSPIRRYPDLLLHRAIKHVLKRGKPKDFAYSAEQMEGLGLHCSGTERRADEATRDVSSWLKCEFMSHRVGDVFDGVVSSVTSFGLFVDLTGLFIDGLIHVSALGEDNFVFDKSTQRLVGKRNGRAFSLGQSIKVQVARVNLEERKIDLVPAEGQGGQASARGSETVQHGRKDSPSFKSRGQTPQGKGKQPRFEASSPNPSKRNKKRRSK